MRSDNLAQPRVHDPFTRIISGVLHAPSLLLQVLVCVSLYDHKCPQRISNISWTGRVCVNLKITKQAIMRFWPPVAPSLRGRHSGRVQYLQTHKPNMKRTTPDPLTSVKIVPGPPAIVRVCRALPNFMHFATESRRRPESFAGREGRGKVSKLLLLTYAQLLIKNSITSRAMSCPSRSHALHHHRLHVFDVVQIRPTNRQKGGVTFTPPNGPPSEELYTPLVSLSQTTQTTCDH